MCPLLSGKAPSHGKRLRSPFGPRMGMVKPKEPMPWVRTDLTGARKRPVHGQEPPPDNVEDRIYVKVARFEIGRNPGLWIGGALIRVRMRSSSGPDKKRHVRHAVSPAKLTQSGREVS